MICPSATLTAFRFRQSLRILVLAVALPTGAVASVGQIIIIHGESFAVDANNERRHLDRRSEINQGDTLMTGPDGSLQIRFIDNAILALGPNSHLRIRKYHASEDANRRSGVVMDLRSGGFRTLTGNGNPDSHQVHTPYARLDIGGAHYEARLDQTTLLLGVYEGDIIVSNAEGSLNLGTDGEFLFARVASTVKPEGLLNAPELLSQSTVPATGMPGLPQPADEPYARLTRENDNTPLYFAFTGNEPPPLIPHFPDEKAAAIVSLLFQLKNEREDLENELENLGDAAEALDENTDVPLIIE